METEKETEPHKIPPHLSAEEHSLLIAEEQLLKEGAHWLKRAAKLYTQTPKLRIWLPVLGSLILTIYYLHAIHSFSSQGGAAPPPSTAPAAPASTQAAPAVVVEEDAATPQTGGKTPPLPPSPIADNASDADLTDADLLQRAQQAHASQQFAEEARYLQKIVDHGKDIQQACPAIGKAYERANQIDSAIEAFEHCSALAPGDIDTLLGLAHALQAKPDLKRASALYRQTLQNDPGNQDAQAGLALVELKQNHLAEADSAATTILRKSPDNTDALLITGIVAWRQSRLADAERIFSRGVMLDDHRPDFHVFLGRIAEAQRRPQEALQQYEKALQLDPSDTDTTDRRNRLQAVAK
jgi:tetratricopeptide (TPR) repeat protein